MRVGLETGEAIVDRAAAADTKQRTPRHARLRQVGQVGWSELLGERRGA